MTKILARAIGDPGIRQKIVDAGVDPLQSTPREFIDYIRSEQDKSAKVIKDGSITVE